EGDGQNAISDPESFEVQAGATKTIYVRIENQACFTIVALKLSTYITPVIESLKELDECDNSSGSYEFDLTANEANIIGNQNPDNIHIAYFTSEEDAQSNTNPITDPAAFDVDSGCETIYVRIENENHPDCYETGSFKVCGIEIDPGIPQNLMQCVLQGTRYAIFDLTQNEGNLLDRHDSSAFLFTYYLTSEDAEEGVNPIGNPENYHAENYPETIYVRMESAENSA